MKIWVNDKCLGNIESIKIHISSYEAYHEEIVIGKVLGNNREIIYHFYERHPNSIRPLWARKFKKPSLE